MKSEENRRTVLDDLPFIKVRNRHKHIVDIKTELPKTEWRDLNMNYENEPAEAVVAEQKREIPRLTEFNNELSKLVFEKICKLENALSPVLIPVSVNTAQDIANADTGLGARINDSNRVLVEASEKLDFIFDSLQI